MTKLRRLKAEALECCKFRGHYMGRFFQKGMHVHRHIARCRKCAMGVIVDTASPPNGIDIGGEAVALGCGDPR